MKKQSRRASPKPRATQDSRYLRISHRRHTGHVLPRRSTSYPLLAMILLCTGVLLSNWTHIVTADVSDSGSYAVQGQVLGTPPAAATITTPHNGDSFTATPIHVTGSCPLNTYVQIFRNDVPSGVVICDSSGHYDIQVPLFSGANSLIARSYNFADLAGPDSATVIVYYNPPAGTPNAQVAPVSDNGSATTRPFTAGTPVSPLLLKTIFHYKGFYTGQTISWQLYIEGGTPPYALSINWGDGKTDLVSRPGPDTLNLRHTYKKAGGYRGSYQIKVTATDSAGQSTFLQVLSVVNNPPGAAGSLTPGNTVHGIGILSSGRLGPLVKYAWPTYGILLLMLTSFWLGERREYKLLKYLQHKPHRV